DTLISMNGLAGVLQSQGKLSEAEPLRREALAGARATLGDAHPTTLKFLNDLAVLLQEAGKQAEAEPLLREALGGFRAKLGPGHLNTLRSQAALASLLRSRGELADAAALFEQAIELGRGLPPSASEKLVREMETKLRDLYRAWSKLEPSAEHDRRAAELDAAL